jgi:Tfp pilus assembly protein PilO
MPIASSYPLLDVFWTVLIFFAWVIYIWLFIVLIADIFRRRDIGGWAKAAWVVFMILLPFIGVLAYLIFEHDGIAQRNTEQAQQAQQQFDQHVREVASSNGGGAAEQIQKAADLLKSGAITQEEFDQLKAKALAAP